MPKILQMAELYVRQVGEDPDFVSRKAFNNDKLYFQELDRVLDELFEEAEERGLSWGQLADMAEIGQTTVKNLGERWTRRPQYRTVILIAAALDQVVQLEVIEGRARPSLRVAQAG